MGEGVLKESALCTLVKMLKMLQVHVSVKIEDEYHVIFKCSRYSDLRGKYIGKNIVKKSSMFKFINLIVSENYGVVRKLGIFCHFAFKRYDSTFL